VKTRGYGALAGLAAAAAALGVAELVAILTGPQSSPLVAVGGVVVDAVPAPVKDFAVSVFYTYDKLALMIGTLLIIAVLAVGFGVLSLRNVAYGVIGVGIFGVVGLVAAVTRANAGPFAALPALIGAATGALVLVGLLNARPKPAVGTEGPALEPGTEEPSLAVSSAAGSKGTAPAVRAAPVASVDVVPDPETRRRFLRLAGGTFVGAAVVGFGSHWLTTRRNVSADRASVRLPAPADRAPALPEGADFQIPRLSPFVTNNGTFYRIDTALVVPQVAAATWTLKIHGRVRNPLTITYDELLKRPMIERYVTLACVSNEVGGNLVGNARWLGVPIKDLLDEADPEDGADQVVSRSVDGFTAGTPAALLRDGRDAILAIGMNGEPLPIDHGFPVRMVVPGLYGYVSATKWLAELELTSFADFDAYWIRRGWSRPSPIKTQSRIDTPSDGDPVKPGRVAVAGVAWAQHRGISKVEVRVDEGAWQEARLAAVPSIDTWRQWSLAWDATPGKHTITVRASDNAGATQPEEPSPPDPDGATGWHSVEVEVR
jgi:DMSO/TMAO reductase YedYZ molybdopterin-dependent catalytic subunit